MSTTTFDAEHDGGAVKPKLRGVLHQWAAVTAFGAGLVLVALAPSARAAVAAGLFALSLVVLFGVSATYHRVTWSPRARTWMRRLDHASIFILIAGTYTPIAMLGLTPELGRRVLVMIWTGATLGVLQSLFWVGAPKPLVAILAVALGWTMVPHIGDAFRMVGPFRMGLVAVGGVAYTLGAVAYALKRPNPKPGVFGYHEVFHALTLVGALFHFVAVLLIVRGSAA